MSNVFIFIIFLLMIMILTTTSNASSMVDCKCVGGETIWDTKCLKRQPDLKELLHNYKRKKIGKKLFDFICYYKPSVSSSSIIKYLVSQNFKMTSSRLQSDGYYIDSTGEKTSTNKYGVPHFIFTHKDHSCIRLKPVIGGVRESYTPFPTISLSIVYDPNELPTFHNEAFKVTRDGESIPKAGYKHSDACLNPNLSEFRINNLMKSTHLKLPKPSIEDIQFFRTFMSDV